MQAAVVTRYGAPEVVRVTEVPRPEPGSGEVLVRVVRRGGHVGRTARIRAARFPSLVRGRGPPGLRFAPTPSPDPRQLVSGVVDAVGRWVVDVAPGDEVCGMTGSRWAPTRSSSSPRRRTRPQASGGVAHDAAGCCSAAPPHCSSCATRVGAARLHRAGQRGVGCVGTNAVQLARPSVPRSRRDEWAEHGAGVGLAPSAPSTTPSRTSNATSERSTWCSTPSATCLSPRSTPVCERAGR